jgi:hypothetical protein
MPIGEAGSHCKRADHGLGRGIPNKELARYLSNRPGSGIMQYLFVCVNRAIDLAVVYLAVCGWGKKRH